MTTIGNFIATNILFGSLVTLLARSFDMYRGREAGENGGNIG